MGGVSGLFGGGPVAGVQHQLGGLGSTLAGQGQQIFDPAFNQFVAGATGQLTPSQQAAVTQTLNQMILGTAGTYGNLGLGGSTMEQQDLGANQLASLAQQQAFEAQSEQLGLQGLAEALGFDRGAISALGGAGTLAEQQQQQQLGALASAAGALGGKGAGGGGLIGDVLSPLTGGISTAVGDVLGLGFPGGAGPANFTG